MFFFCLRSAEICYYGILKSGGTGQMFSLFSRICYNGLPEYFLYSVWTGVDRGVCGVLRLLGIMDLFFVEVKVEYFK